MMQVLTTRTVKICINQLSIANIFKDMLSTRVDYAIPHIPNCAMLSTIAADASLHIILVLCYQKADDTSPYNPNRAMLLSMSDDASPHNPNCENIH